MTANDRRLLSLVPLGAASAQRLEIFPGQSVAGVKLQRTTEMENGLLMVTECGKRRSKVGLGTRIVALELDRGCQFSNRVGEIPRGSLCDSQIIVSVEIIWPGRSSRVQVRDGLGNSVGGKQRAAQRVFDRGIARS